MLHRGSEWHKWDLHVHTPASVLRNGFGTDWDVYVKTLFKTALTKKISAIGITDYFLAEGYRKLTSEYLKNNEKMVSLFTNEEIEAINQILILPNIEFRLKKFVGGGSKDLDNLSRKLNYHVILSNELSIDDIESNFLAQLHFDFTADPGEPAEPHSLTRSNLEEFGRHLKEQHDYFKNIGKSDLYIGMLNASVDENDIAKVLKKSTFKGRFILGPNPDEDLSKVSWNSQGHNTRKTLIKQSSFVFSSNPGTIKFMNGDLHGSVQEFEKEFGARKPCLWGSDAHDFNSLFNPVDNRHTWIKSNLTFGGLKQVVYDPLSRVKISELTPWEKNSYQIIKRVRFVDGRSNPEFGNEWIPISGDLTTIIGGKSSGKSLLLHHIAKAINFEEVVSTSKISHACLYEPLVAEPAFDFEVEWENGAINKLKDQKSSKPITYIPQLYISHLSEEDGRLRLNQHIEDILSQNDDFKMALFDSKGQWSVINKEISDAISSTFLFKDREAEVAKDILAIGIRKEIEGEIENLTARIEALKISSGFSDEDLNIFKALSLRKESLSARKKVIQDVTVHVQKLDAFLEGKSDTLSIFLFRQFNAESYLSNPKIFTNSFKKLAKSLDETLNDFKIYLTNRIRLAPEYEKKIDEQLIALEEVITPLNEKFEDQVLITSLTVKLDDEKEKIKKISALEIKLTELKAKVEASYELIIERYQSLLESYHAIVLEVSDPAYQPKGNLELKAEVTFNFEKFDEFLDLFDKRANTGNLVRSLIGSDDKYRFDVNTHVNGIETILNKIKILDIPPLRRSISQEDTVKRLFSDCFSVRYIVNFNGDEITQMSPGKRGLVLLNLILHLSNSTHPILIDQPEDNLDNRTIYDQLKDFIRSRKEHRQIIMVTHNANLVLAADAECVIVANQSGQNVGNDNKQYRFEYCGGAIEVSFLSPSEVGLLNKKGIREHICEILEGGLSAFRERELKYGLKY